MAIKILMPALSPTMQEGKINKWIVKIGDRISSGDIIAEVETDKATMEVEAVDEGTITHIIESTPNSAIKVNSVIALLNGNKNDKIECEKNKLVDNNINISEDLEAKQKLETILIQAEQAAQAQVSARWEADMKHGSWLSKNIRPITLIFLTGVFVILSVFDGNMGEFTIGEAYVPVYQTLLMTVYAAYFAGRSIEKVKKVTK